MSKPKISKLIKKKISFKFKISNWLDCNKLYRNTDKTKCMFFCTKMQLINPILYMILDSVDNFNVLSFVLNSNIKWNCHIKISRAIGVSDINILIHLYCNISVIVFLFRVLKQVRY